MGSSHSVELIAAQESVSEPGTKSIISASLDELDPPVSSQEFLEQFAIFYRYPVDPMGEAVLKRVELMEDDPYNYTVKVVMDGKKLDSYGYGRGDGTDRVRVWKKVSVDVAGGKASIVDYVPEMEMGAWIDEASDKEGSAGSVQIDLLKDPTRIEFRCGDKEGHRHASEAVRDALYSMTDTLISQVQAAATAKVKVAADAPSMKSPGQKSVISQSMDQHVTFGGMFDAMLKVVKEKLKSTPDAEINEISDSEFVVSATTKDLEGKDRTRTMTVRASREKGEITQENREGGQVKSTTHIVFHSSPLVAEVWVDSFGGRQSGAALGAVVQKDLNMAIDKASSWFG